MSPKFISVKLLTSKTSFDRGRTDVRTSPTHEPDLDLWPWPSIRRETRPWPTCMQTLKVNGHSAPKTEWKRTDRQTMDGRREATAPSPMPTRSVINNQNGENENKTKYNIIWFQRRYQTSINIHQNANKTTDSNVTVYKQSVQFQNQLTWKYYARIKLLLIITLFQ